MRQFCVPNNFLRMNRLCPVVLTAFVLIACSAAPPPPDETLTPSQAPEPTSSLSVDDEVKAAFADTDPQARRTKVLSAVQRLLDDPAIQSVSDADATIRLTDLAFASGAIKLTDPAYVRRHDTYAVVALPDGMGLYFFAPSQAPIEINRFTVGLTTLNPVWRENEIGVPYETRGTDGAITSQFALLTQTDSGWQMTWSSADTPDWWFNARNGSLMIEPDLSRIALSGQAPGNTLVFNEAEETVQREFRIVWLRSEETDTYQPELPPDQFSYREAWLWRIAVPSPYSSMVEFIERLQRNDREGLLRLVLNGEVIEDARDFGFALLNQTYDVILSEPDRIVIRGYQGVFEFSFAPPDAEGDPYVITSIKVGGGE